MYCRKCGIEIPFDSIYCHNCGEKLLLKEELPLKLIESHYEMFIYALSTFYPFTIDEITTYQDFLIFGGRKLYNSTYSYDKIYLIENHPEVIYGVNFNPNVEWTSEIIDNFGIPNKSIFEFGDSSTLKKLITNFHTKETFIRWKHLLLNKNIIWDRELIDKYLTHFSWRDLINKENVDLEFLLESIEDKEQIKSFSYNIKIKDKLTIIERFERYWDWNYLSENHSIFWTEAYIEKYESKLNWQTLQYNPNIRWTISLLQKYEKKLRIFSEGGYLEIAYDGDGNRYPEKGYYIFGIDRFVDHDLALILINELTKPVYLSKLSLNNSHHIFENLCGFSMNKKIKWDIDLLRKYKSHWDWDILSKNDSINFNEEILEESDFQWNWEKLSCNGGVKWNLKLIEKFNKQYKLYPDSIVEDRLVFGTSYIGSDYCDANFEIIKGLDANQSVEFDDQLISKYFLKWNQNYLINNVSVKWSKNLLLRILNSTLLYKNLDVDEDGRLFQWCEVEFGDERFEICEFCYSKDSLEVKKIEYENEKKLTNIRLYKNYNSKKQIFFEKIGFNFLKNLWTFVFKEYVDFYGIDALVSQKPQYIDIS